MVFHFHAGFYIGFTIGMAVWGIVLLMEQKPEWMRRMEATARELCRRLVERR